MGVIYYYTFKSTAKRWTWSNPRLKQVELSSTWFDRFVIWMAPNAKQYNYRLSYQTLGHGIRIMSRAQSYQPKIPGILQNYQISKIYFLAPLKLCSCKKIWTFLKTSGQPTTPKNVSKYFSEYSRRIGRVKIFRFFQNIFQNSDFWLIGLSPHD